MNTISKCTAIAVLLCVCAVRDALCCTAIVVGRKASTTGRVLIGHNEDVSGAVMRHAMLPAKDGNAEVFWSEAKKKAGGDTVGALVYSERGVLVVSNNGGVMRSWDGETFALPEEGACSSVTGEGIGYDLRFRAVERAHTARECLDAMIALVEKHGYNQYSRNFLIADSSEAWILEVLYGRRYVARRVPDDGVVVYPNCLIFNKLREGDLASENIRAKGADFDVIGFYQGPRTWKSPYNLYRWMETYRTVAGVCPAAGDEYPFSVKPAHAVSPADVKKALCSHYEGRPCEVKERHPKKNPKIVVPVCRNTTVQSLVCEMGSVPAETVMHLTVGRPCEVGYEIYRPFGKVLPEDTVFGEEALWRLKNRELPAGAKFAGKTLFVGISESFPMGEKASKVMVNADYACAVSKGGHIPVVIPRYGSDADFDELVAKLDVLVMTGGEDFDPAIYNEKRSPKLGTVNSPRDDFDIRLLNAARRRRLPVVGICRGCQLLNIAFGGSLWQDLPSEYPAEGVQHRNVYHRIDIDPSSRMAGVLGTTNLVVNSYHHQAVKRLAPGFKIVARSPEGVVEAIESSEYPAIGFQFHPEKMLCKDKEEIFRKLFENIESLVR